MQKYKIIVAYDGTDFFGWQKQPDHISVSSCLEHHFARIFGHNITLVGASRTDTGVHAYGQVATFYSPLQLSPETFITAWNKGLPFSIHIRTITLESEAFHPCRNVLQKTYTYRLFLSRPLPFIARYGWHYHFINQVDHKKFAQALACYTGTHDFSSFCKIDDGEDKSPVRTIDEIFVTQEPEHNALLVTIKGKSFLRFQIRRMIGYALDVARRSELSVDYLKGLLKHPNPQQTLVKADGSGLCLQSIRYAHE